MSRRFAREVALKLLFQIDVGKNSPDEVIDTFFSSFQPEESAREFILQLTYGTLDNLKNIDKVLTDYSKDWPLDRMANVDRNVLRLALFEIIFMEDIPSTVSINEGIELAKKYSTEDSGKFVNGILGKIAANKESIIEKYFRGS